MARPSLLLFLAAWLLAAPAALASPGAQAPFEELGEAFKKAHPIPEAPPSPPAPPIPDTGEGDDGAGGKVTEADSGELEGEEAVEKPPTVLDLLVREHYATARLGAIELCYPAAFLDDPKRCDHFLRIACGLLDLQRVLADWVAADRALVEEVGKDAAVVKGWLAGLTAAKLGSLAKAQPKEIFAALGAPEEVLQARARLAERLVDTERLGVAPQYTDGLKVVLSPTRRDWVELVGFLGLDDPEWRHSYWIDGTEEWTRIWNGLTLIVALEYPPWGGCDSQFRSFFDPARLDPDGVLHYALNEAARGLLYRIFNRAGLERFERALAANLVIATAGRIAIIDGDGEIKSTGASTAPYERFVPGGLSSGGILPAIPAAPLDALATSRWREGKGADLYVGVLRKGQKEGAKQAGKDKDSKKRKDKLAHFPLQGDGSGCLVSAPFLGPFAKEQPYPPHAFLNDFRELFAAYETCFLHWLRTAAHEGSAEASAARFADLVRTLGALGSTEAYEPVLEGHYGVPISARDGSTDSLEWRFLSWLAAEN